MLDRWRVRLRGLFRARTVHDELDEELRFHLDAETERHIARGMDPTSAALAARRGFGNPTQLREEMRDAVIHRWLERLSQDIRYAWRAFRRAPLFALTVVATIALALGLNTTAFTIFDAYVLRPAAVRDPGSLVQLHWTDRTGADRGFSWRGYEALRADRDVLSETFAYRLAYTRIDSLPAFGQLVTGNYFAILGVGSSLGRTLIPADAAEAGAAPVVVLSYDTWTSRFAGDSSIVGKTIRLRGRPFQVVGVAARGFSGLGGVPLDFWTPITMNDVLFEGDDLFGARDAERLAVLGRIRPDVPTETGEAWLLNWLRDHHPDSRDRERPVAARLLTGATAIRLSPAVALFFSPIATAFVLVLLIACANVANMMLARGMARQRELGVRLSLGASRGRLVRQLLTEAALLASVAAGLGFIVARLTVNGAVRLMYRTLAAEIVPYIRIVPLTLDWRVFLFMLGATATAVILFALVPALQATRTNIVQATRGEFGSDERPSRLRNALVVGQVTVCALLLICAGVLLGSVRDLHPDGGLTAHGILWLQTMDRPAVRARVLEALRGRPELQGVAAATQAPFSGQFPRIVVMSADRRAANAYTNFVSASYFDLLGMRVLRGRSFTPAEERDGAAVAIVSDATARALWPGRDALGETLHLTFDSSGAGQTRFASRNNALVIGLVPNAALGTVIDPLDSPVVYYPTAIDAANTYILAKVSGVAEVTMRNIDRELARLAPDAVTEIHTLEGLRVATIYPFRAAYWIAGLLGAIALALTVSGVYGVLSYVVAQRRKELGIRMALGATTARMAVLVLGQSVKLCAIGLVLGATLAAGVARVFSANLLRLQTFQPLAFLGAALLVMLSSLAAAYIPSRRAARADPMDALRDG
ncbi:MAG: ADOP family duplicated permease [Gemmatimonadaceae bacterium]